MIRTRFIEGLRDKTIRERVFVDGISFQDVVKMATRKEALATKTQSEFSPRGEDSRATVPFEAVGRQPSKPSDHRGGFSRNQGYNKVAKGSSDERRPSAFLSNMRRDWGETGKGNGNPCKRCGVMEHRRDTCPAEKAPCFKCGMIGHFGRMCKKEVRLMLALRQFDAYFFV